ncbi:MAG: glycosyltransferase [Verrucomicrobiia bacterium]
MALWCPSDQSAIFLAYMGIPPAANPIERSAIDKDKVDRPITEIGTINSAASLFIKGDYSKAWDEAIESIKERPFNPDAFILLGSIASVTGNFELAAELINLSISLAPENPEALSISKRLSSSPIAAEVKLSCIDDLRDVIKRIDRLTVCIIAKNEEKNIEGCLKSILPIASQIIVVDTGSQDSTADIARMLGAEVYNFAWVDDFSAARNFALGKARCGWVLTLDADEQISSEEHEKLIAHLQNRAVIAYRLPLVNVGREIEGACYVPRLFRNLPGIFYKGRIHEQIFPTIIPFGKRWGLKICVGSVRIQHYGYKPELTKAKVSRNLRLLTMAINEQPQDSNILMNLALELCRSGKVDEGIEYYRKAFEALSKMSGDSITPEMRETLLTQYGTFLFSKQRYDDVVRLLTSKLATNYGGLNASHHYLLGYAFYKLKKIEQAATELKSCISKLDKPTYSHALSEIYKGEPHYLLAVCYAVLNKVKEADKEFNRALQHDPESLKFNYDYARFLAGHGDLVRALELLNKVIAGNSTNPAVWQLGARIALNNQNLIEFALQWTEEALKFCPDNPELIEYRADALLLNGRIDEAIECFERLPVSARQQASIIFCEVIKGDCNRSYDEVNERAISFELIKLYRQCINSRALSVINCFHDNVGALQSALPTAAQIIKKALFEAGNS